MPDLLPTTLVFLHVLGAAAWVGGQLALAPMTRALRETLPPEARRPALRALARRAQPVLWAGLVLAAASGLLLLRYHGASPIVAWKVALTVAAAVGAGAHTLAPRRGWPPAVTGLGAAVALLAGLALVALGAALRWS
jgi:uncharacterized membrane protein